MSESKKRDFVSQLIILLEQNAPALTDKGYEPANKIAQLQLEITTADEAEARQAEAQAAAKDATKLAQNTLDVAYRDASATVDLISGLLGKNNNLLGEIRKMRS
ncbi:MAG TPA: hypothetical protein VJ919_13330 [Tangfeifania sp.]|nr:hypothetical protein [Tangfeifania sp.]